MAGKRLPANSASVPAPVGGWNARDSQADMPATDAIQLDNFFPNTTDVQLRLGYEYQATGFPASVDSIFSYVGNTGSTKIFGASGTSFYDATAGGAIGAAVVTGLANAKWNYINFTVLAGTAYLVCVNGVDTARKFDGTNWTTWTVTGVNTNTFTYVWAHQKRLWAIQTQSMVGWYLPVSSITGTATAFDFTGLFEMGGYLVAGGTWTLDAGDGVDDYFIVASSEGELLVYRGTDPSSSTTWSMVGRWVLGKPLGTRPFMKYGGDLLYIAQDGVWPISKALLSSSIDRTAALTDKIYQAIVNAGQLYQTNFGWDLMLWPGSSMLMLNVPVTGTSQQYVMNTITQAWGRFLNIQANCWELCNGIPYFGGTNFIGKYGVSYDDAGNNITATAKQSYNYFGSRGINKRFTMARPILQCTGTPALSFSISLDYDNGFITTPAAFTGTSYGLWDSAIWDVSVWGGDLSVIKNWQGITGVGYCAAGQIYIVSKGIDVHWVSTDYVYEKGAYL